MEGDQYCTSLDRTFQLLVSENFNSFVLAIGICTTVIYCEGNVGMKVFHSYARDIMEDAWSSVQAACVLLEVLSLNSLVHYFRVYITMMYLN